MPRKKSPPAYRLHRARNCAVVFIGGVNHYLGAYGSTANYEKYAPLITQGLQPARIITNSFERTCAAGSAVGQ